MSGAIFTPVEPVALNKPAYGAGMPPNVSHGSLWSAAAACSPGRGSTAWGCCPVDEHEPREVVRAGFPLKSQVAYAVVIDPRASGREHDLAAFLLGRFDDALHVLDLDVHAPVARERDVGVRDELEVLRDAGVGDEAEVGVSSRRGMALPFLAWFSTEWSSRKLSRRSIACTCQPFDLRTMSFARARRGRSGGTGHEDEDVLGVVAGPMMLILSDSGGRSRRGEAGAARTRRRSSARLAAFANGARVAAASTTAATINRSLRRSRSFVFLLEEFDDRSSKRGVDGAPRWSPATVTDRPDGSRSASSLGDRMSLSSSPVTTTSAP